MSENQLTNPSREAEIAARIAKWAGLADDCTLPTVELGDMRYLLAHLQQARQIEQQLNEAIAGERKMRSECAAALQQAREALLKFGRHHDQCTHTFGMQDVPCTCGLDAALKAVR